ncbi:LCP family protein [Boudabousia liubingyangii]|nr:LCP family protein [Boudabousia liubingyangii]
MSENLPSRAQSGTASKRRWPKIVLLVLLVLALIFGGTAAYLIWATTKNIESLPINVANYNINPNGTPEPGSEEEQAKGTINFLVLGSDSRISAGDPNKWEYGAQRTDAIMIVQINEKRDHINILSLPRDSWVEIPGHGKNKINAAFSFGGPQLTIQTIHQLTGIRIDHFAVADFDSFKKVTDELGGVTIKTTDGEVTLNGKEALKFVRERKHLPNGDFDRVRRQQAWMRAMMQKVFTSGVLNSPTSAMSLIQTATENSAVDEGFSTTDMLSLALSLRNLRSKDVTFLSAPNLGSGRSDGGASIVNLDFDQLAVLTKAFREGKVQELLDSNPEMKKLELSSKVR